MRYLILVTALCALSQAHAQHIFGHAAVFTGPPERREVKGELTVIDVDLYCELIMLIEVDRTGHVVAASVEPGLPVCPDTAVVNKALRSARARVFNADPNAPERQMGRIHWAYKQPEDMVMDVAMPDAEEVDTKVYHRGNVEQAPTFPGGKAAMDQYFQRYLHYPEEALAARTDGAPFFSFIVEKDGSLSTFTLEKGVERSLNQEGMRLLMHMPKWIPGRHNGDPVRVQYEMPVVFTLPPETHAGDIHGSGEGNGVGRGPYDEQPFHYVLNGRTLLKQPKVEYAGAESGRIVLDIEVDLNGKVLSAEPGRGTTTTAKALTKAARKAALTARFNAAPQANERQRGRMIFSFPGVR